MSLPAMSTVPSIGLVVRAGAGGEMAAGLRGEVEGTAELRGRRGRVSTRGCPRRGLAGRGGEQRVEYAEVGQVHVEIALKGIGRGRVRAAAESDAALGVHLDLAGLDRGVVVGDDDLRVDALDLRALGLESARGHVERAVDFLVVRAGRGGEVTADVSVDFQAAAERGVGRAVGRKDRVEFPRSARLTVIPPSNG